MTSTDRVEYRAPCPKCRERGRDRAGDNLAVFGDGHSYCFACGYLIPAPSISRLRSETRTVSDVKEVGDLDWPKDYVRLSDMESPPREVIAWLRSYGITDHEINKHRFGWSKDRLLLVLPVFDLDNNIIMWQGRNFGEGSKYLTFGPKRDILHMVGKTNRGVLIMTEDLISAIKVGREYQAAPLWGAEMSLGLIKKAASLFDVLGLWLDADKVTKSVEIALRASQYIPTFIIHSGLDPKNYNGEYIHEFVEQAGYKQYYKDEVKIKTPPEDESLLVPISKGPNPEPIKYSDPNVDLEEKLDSLPAKGKQNFQRIMESLAAKTPCPKCQVKSPDIKKVCALQGCPFFIAADCEAGASCHERQCGTCTEEYGEACLKAAKSFHPSQDRPWDYRKSTNGS